MSFTATHGKAQAKRVATAHTRQHITPESSVFAKVGDRHEVNSVSLSKLL